MFNIVLFTFTVIGLSVLLTPYREEGLLLILLMIIISLIGFFSGVVAALGLTLLLYFLIGSSYFWMAFTGTVVFNYDISNSLLLLWMISLLIIAMLTGRFSTLVKGLSSENSMLKEEVRMLVAVDPVTGFDNKERMLIELESEFNRSKRYDQTFLFLIMKVTHIEQFRKLYGEDEYVNMLQHLAKGIHNHTRSSDLKFRPESNMFALLLTHTPGEHRQLIIDKLNQALRIFQLQNKKIVTLNFEFGHVDFTPEMNDFLTIYEQAKEQVSFNVS